MQAVRHHMRSYLTAHIGEITTKLVPNPLQVLRQPLSSLLTRGHQIDATYSRQCTCASLSGGSGYRTPAAVSRLNVR